MADVPDVISIDPASSRDLDDAISAIRTSEGWIVDVCVPDVGAMVDGGSPIDRQARERLVTRYGGNMVRRFMLPGEVTERLSLSPSGKSPMGWFRIKLNDRLQVKHVGVARIDHQTTDRLSYPEADRILTDDGHVHHQRLLTLWELSRRLHERRRSGTGAVFDPEGHLYTNEEGVVSRLTAANSHRSHLIVMEMMILTNATLAAHARDRGIPVIYRNHVPKGRVSGLREHVRRDLMIEAGGDPEDVRRRMGEITSHMDPAELDGTSRGHFGLDLPHYAWFTSPLRRYCDMVNLRSLLQGIADPDIAATAAHIDLGMRALNEEQSEYHGRRSRRKMAGHVIGRRVRLLGEFDMHTVIRACVENDVIHEQLSAMVIDRTRAGMMSGRDMAAVFTYGREVIPETAIGDVAQWLRETPAAHRKFVRDMVAEGLLTHVPEGAAKLDVNAALGRLGEIFGIDIAPEPDEAAAADATIGKDGIDMDNPKGRLLEMATAARAKVVFGEATRIGPPHAPIFTVDVSWEGGDRKLTATGSGETIREATKLACARLVEKLPKTSPVVREAATTTAANPKSALLEMATARGGVVRFADVSVSGPPHAPTFIVKAIYGDDVRTVEAEGGAGSRKGAEREAARTLLEKIGG